MPQNFVIVGASLAGATAAAELRELGFDGSVVLVGAEPHLPYERPPLTKQLLRGETSAEEAQVFPREFYDEHGIELRLGTRAEAIDREARQVVLDDGSRLDYDRLLIATGAEPIRLELPGSELDGVLTLRTVDDVAALRARLRPGVSALIVGAGWIGMEAAASLRQTGAAVTVVEAGTVPLARVVGEELGHFFAALHREQGVELVTGNSVERLVGDGHVTGAVLADGREVACDLVLFGVGVRPALQLAAAGGLATSNGIEVDASLRTSDPDVFAAGDVALAAHPRYGALRVEHWENARRQGKAVAAAMLGRPVSFDAIPYFFSDQYDLGLEYSGHPGAGDELVIRGDVDAGEFIAFWTHGGRVTAGMNVNVWDVAEDIRRLIADEVPVTGAQLADAGAPLGRLLAANA